MSDTLQRENQQNETQKNEGRHGRAQTPGLVLGLVLGIDTCGPTGSAVLARVEADGVETLGLKELAGKTYSATLISTVGELLGESEADLAMLRAIVIVNGPGSFTGVRVGVSAAKGLAEGRGLGLVPVSRLAALAAKAGTDAAALDAHRGEVFLRLGEEGTELLAGKDELGAIERVPARIAVCEEAAAALLASTWPNAELVRTEAPTAVDAIAVCVGRVKAGEFADVALLDGHYLRRSDAEIFGEPGARAKS